jgi:hypothetical protein
MGTSWIYSFFVVAKNWVIRAITRFPLEFVQVCGTATQLFVGWVIAQIGMRYGSPKHRNNAGLEVPSVPGAHPVPEPGPLEGLTASHAKRWNRTVVSGVPPHHVFRRSITSCRPRCGYGWLNEIRCLADLRQRMTCAAEITGGTFSHSTPSTMPYL